MDLDNEIVYDFGFRVRQLREGKKLTQKVFAGKLDVSKETLYRYENNLQMPGVDRVKRMAIILDTSVDYLLGIEDRYTIKLPALTSRQRDALNEFIDAFIVQNK